MSRSRTLLLVLVAVAAAILAGACEVRSEVAIRVEPDGSGVVAVTVRLDAEAARRLGDPAAVLSTQDLVAAGWTVEEPEAADGGGVALAARRSFASPEDLPSVLAEVGGADGVFRDVQLSVRDGAAVWSFPVSGGEPTSATLTATSTTTAGSTRLLALAGVLALLLAAALGAVGLWRRRG